MRSEVQIFPDPPVFGGAIAQLGERLHGMQEVVGSIPSGSTKSGMAAKRRIDAIMNRVGTRGRLLTASFSIAGQVPRSLLFNNLEKFLTF